MTESERLILAFFVLAVFAYQGWRRGFISELVKFFLILLGILVGTPEWLGSAVVRIINSIWFLFQIAINGGVTLVISGDFSAQALDQVMSDATQAGPLIPPNNVQAALFFFMLVLILLGYLISARVKKRSTPILGLFMGVVNGLLLAYLFVVPLVPESYLPELQNTSFLGGLFSLFGVALDALLAPIKMLYEQVGPVVVIGIMVIIIILAARNVRK
ncbi:MAG: hypothetical protein J5I90_10340 [Caldilineales bacterium]|nr:hypothetical protein [Caldilineales bacterium]